MKEKKRMNAGFTLTELLISIFIMGLLAALIFPNFMRMRASSRDAQRMTDVTVLQNLLERHFNRHGVYPTTLGAIDSSIRGTLPSEKKAGWPSYTYEQARSCGGGATPSLGYRLSFTAETDRFIGESGVFVSGSTICVGP